MSETPAISNQVFETVHCSL